MSQDPQEELRTLRRLLEEEQQRREDAERRREDAERRLEEEQQRREEEQQRREDTERQRRDVEAVNFSLREELNEKALVQLDQDLNGYLQCVHGLNFSLGRLVPTLPRSRPQTLSEGEKSKATTSGRTSIVGKYYPHKMRTWTDFDDICRQSFARIQAVLGYQQVFPSVTNMRAMAQEIEDELPHEFLGSESFLNEMKTSQFIHKTLQIPVRRILNEYLKASGQQKKVFFDNYTSRWGQRSMQTSVLSGDGEESGIQVAARPLPKTQPDCYVLATDTMALPGDMNDSDDDDDGDANEFSEEFRGSGAVYDVRRISLAEHKALYRLRAATMSRYVDGSIPEDYMVQLARIASKQATGDEQEEVARRAEKGVPGQVFYARALTQAFHYMVSSGVEFGYIATGETLSFLRVPAEDPTTLLYHACLFPQYVSTPGSTENDGQLSDDERGCLAVSMLSAITLMALETTPSQARERGFNLSQLTRFPELPASSTAASSPGGSSVSRKRRRGEDNDQDNTDNESYGDDDDGPSTSSNMDMSTGRRHQRTSPLKKQWNTSDADSGGPAQTHTHAGMKRERGEHRVVWVKQRAKPGLRRWDVNGRRPERPTLPSQRDPSTFRPIRPFCTQGCLRGLVHGEEMDPVCPNVLLHMQAARRDSGSLPASVEHALTLDELRELVQLQLLSNAEQDCSCMLERGLVGAIGCLFKITVTGYGYTFVAKGVESLNSYRLLREVRVYKRLAEQQGVTIPVCLGIVPLLLPYPMTNGALITHMLLMSYAGLGLHSRRAQRLAEMGHVDLEHEEERTLRELEAVGLVDRDHISNGNLTWSHELQRVMKIDFDHALSLLRFASHEHFPPLPPMDKDAKAVIVGISGCSSSGKTTLARVLRDIFPQTFILHEDDFYREEDELPIRHGVRDWDCIEAISVKDMEAALAYIHAHGIFPPFINSKEDQNSIGTCPIPPDRIAAAKARVVAWLSTPTGASFVASNKRICLLDGFLLFTPSMSAVMSLLQVKLFLLVSRAKATQRREARDGYVTLEGFWKDPPGYVEKIVWPNYVESHSWMFRDGNVEGPVDEAVVLREGIKVQSDKGLDVELAHTLDWAVSEIINHLEAAM
ncbi:hypothetical protein BROUX41_006696 [Berkeleyomyces rouxiae]|uniref:uncharacterized protein n=1 Tax=Berkeleyomyces rouxiae TaxID=2035830 RepID=UPI003B75D8FE